MELSIFLARLIGLDFLIVALIFLLRKEHILNIVDNFMASESATALAGGLGLIAGLAILIGHPVWELSWRVLITLIGLFAVIQGILRLGFTSEMRVWFSRDRLEHSYWLIFIVYLVLGLFLTYHGFHHPVM